MASNKLSVSDFDGVFYKFLAEHALEMNIAFSLAAQALSPDVSRELDRKDLAKLSIDIYGSSNRIFDEIQKQSLQKGSIGQFFNQLSLDSIDPVSLSKMSFLLRGDSTDFFVALSEKTPHQIDPKRAHKMAHRILNTRGWTPVKGLAQSIKKLQSQGDFVIWTHGTKECVLQNMDRLGIYGLVKAEHIYDMYDIGRKDDTHIPYLELCRKYKVDPNNAALYEDTLANLEVAKDAEFNTVAVLHETITKIPEHVDRVHWDAEKAFRNVAEFLQSIHTGMRPSSHGTPQGAVLAPR